MGTERIHLFLTLIALTASLNAFVSPVAMASGSSAEEQVDRVVDQAAVDAQKEAEEDLETLLKKYTGTAREAQLLLRLSEARLEMAETLFRVVYAPGQESYRGSHQAVLVRAVGSLTRLLSAYPSSAEYPRGLFLRGKAHQELRQLSAAAKDFELFLARYSSRDEASLAAIGVADIAIQQKQYKRAISVLAGIASKPEHPFYLNALQKRAWSFHVEGQQMSAIGELNRMAGFFKAHAAANTLTPGQQAIREATFSDVPSVAYAAFRQTNGRYSLNQANQLLRSFDSGEAYRSMAAQVANRLRSADLPTELRAWTAMVLKTDPSRKDHLPLLVSLLKYELEREAYIDAVMVAKDIAGIVAANPTLEASGEAKSLVLQAAERLTKRIADYRKDVRVTQAEKHLNGLLPVIDEMLGPQDSRRFIVRWNLAEAFFSLNRYESAAQAYRWIQKNWVNGMSVQQISPQTAGLKAIAARYEFLRESSVIPKELKAASTVKSSLSPAKMSSLREWIGWLDEMAAGGISEELSGFMFEGNRALYQAGQMDESLDRSRALALARPQSKVAMASASLVVDTWIARKNWERIEATSAEFANVSTWTSKTYASKMAKQASQARFKRAEEAFRKYAHQDAIAHAEYFLKNYPRGDLTVDAMGIACNSYMALRDQDAALKCFVGIADHAPKSAAAKQALRTAAQIEDDRFRFASAAALYLRYLQTRSLDKNEGLAVRRRVLKLVRASGDVEAMTALSSGKAVCVPELRSECELNQTIASFIDGVNDSGKQKRAVKKVTTAPKELRAIWATLAIQRWNDLDSRSFSSVVNALADHWSSVDVSVRYLLIPRLASLIPDAMTKERKYVSKLGLTAEEKSLLKRLDALQAFETRAGLVARIPLDSIRLSALDETYQAYAELISDLKGLPAPRKASAAEKAEHNRLLAKMAHPFILKSRKLKDQVTAIEARQKRGVKVEQIGRIWKTPYKGTSTFDAVRKEWESALGGKNWSRVSFFADESSELRGVPDDFVKAARAASLVEAGAENEARVIFTDACRKSGSTSSIAGACKAAAGNSASLSSRSGKGRG